MGHSFVGRLPWANSRASVFGQYGVGRFPLSAQTVTDNLMGGCVGFVVSVGGLDGRRSVGFESAASTEEGADVLG